MRGDKNPIELEQCSETSFGLTVKKYYKISLHFAIVQRFL